MLNLSTFVNIAKLNAIRTKRPFKESGQDG